MMVKKTKSGVIIPKLARPGDPYVTIRGDTILPEMPEQEPEDRPIAAKTFRAAKKRALKELPAAPDMFNGIACVFVYSTLGVSDREIAVALKITEEDVKEVKKQPGYAECFDMVSGEFINVNSAHLHSRIAAYSHDALTQLGEIALFGKSEGNRLKGSIDILDRAGATKKDAGRQGGMGQNDLRIIMVDGERKVEVAINGGHNGKAE